MLSTSLLLTFAGTLAAAQQTQVPIWVFQRPDVPNFIGGVGSVSTANAESTVLAFSCASDAPTARCPANIPVTVTVGPSTQTASVEITTTAFGGDKLMVTYIQDCDITGSSKAVCGVTVKGKSGGTPMSTASKVTITKADITTVPITITAGASNLEGASTRAAGSGTSSGVAAANTGLGMAAAGVAAMVAMAV